MKIPHDQLSPDALDALLQDFVGREGTDYGDYQYSLVDKIAQVRRQLDQGNVVICFDAHLQSVTILTEQQYRNALLQQEQQSQYPDQL
ncbi:MAG: YheU family protein [Motiliproteus sp.]